MLRVQCRCLQSEKQLVCRGPVLLCMCGMCVLLCVCAFCLCLALCGCPTVCDYVGVFDFLKVFLFDLRLGREETTGIECSGETKDEKGQRFSCCDGSCTDGSAM